MFQSVCIFITLSDIVPDSGIGGAQEETYVVAEVKHDETQQATYVLEEIEFSRALFELYEGGVVSPLCQGKYIFYLFYYLLRFSLCTKEILLL